jgi:hypothetical protein
MSMATRLSPPRFPSRGGASGAVVTGSGAVTD